MVENEKKRHEKKPKKVQPKSTPDFVTKYRRPILVSGLETCVKEKISELCLKHECDIVAMETDRDHIHLLLSYDATERVSDIGEVSQATVEHYIENQG